MGNFLFSDSELSELETLKIMGGTGFISEAQAGCINKARGCGINTNQASCILCLRLNYYSSKCKVSLYKMANFTFIFA